MKIHINLPWGGEFRLEWNPMSKERFEALCFLAGIAIGAIFFYKLLTA